MKPHTRVSSKVKEVSDLWTPEERRERRLLAQAKQRWLWHILEMNSACQQQTPEVRILTKAG